jgi:hypothetical protein
MNRHLFHRAAAAATAVALVATAVVGVIALDGDGASASDNQEQALTDNMPSGPAWGLAVRDDMPTGPVWPESPADHMQTAPGDTPQSPGNDNAAGPGESPQAPPSQGDYERVREPAPIDGVVTVEPGNVAGTYVIVATGGLPGGCAEPGGYDIHQDGSNIDIDVYIMVPAEPRPCTMIYGTYPIRVGLGDSLVPGTTYAVDLNGQTVTFTA